jgi:hypothetical protein
MPTASRWQSVILGSSEGFEQFASALHRERIMAATSGSFKMSDTARNLAQQAAVSQPNSMLPMIAHRILGVRGLADQRAGNQMRSNYFELSQRLSAHGTVGMSDE